MNTMLDAFKKIDDRLQALEAGEWINEIVSVCQEGKPCELRRHYKFANFCSSAVPCGSATLHRVILSKALK